MAPLQWLKIKREYRRVDREVRRTTNDLEDAVDELTQTLTYEAHRKKFRRCKATSALTVERRVRDVPVEQDRRRA